MKVPAQTSKERINIRLESNVKSLLERAAGLEGKSVSKFVLHSALEQAKKTVQDHEFMTLNAEYSRIFLDALESGGRFNRNLNNALTEHSRRVTSK